MPELFQFWGQINKITFLIVLMLQWNRVQTDSRQEKVGSREDIRKVMIQGEGVESARERTVGYFRLDGQQRPLYFLNSASSIFIFCCVIPLLFSLNSHLQILLQGEVFPGMLLLWWIIFHCRFFTYLLHTVFISYFCFLLQFYIDAFPILPNFALAYSGSSVWTFFLCWFSVSEFPLTAFSCCLRYLGSAMSQSLNAVFGGLRRRMQLGLQLPWLTCWSFCHLFFSGVLVSWLGVFSILIIFSCFIFCMRIWSLSIHVGESTQSFFSGVFSKTEQGRLCERWFRLLRPQGGKVASLRHSMSLSPPLKTS